MNIATENKVINNDDVRAEVRQILTDALLGEKDATESIEQLSSVLFPKEDLINEVKSMKIKMELESRFKTIKEKGLFTMREISREENTYTVSLDFSSSKGFTLVHHNITEIAGHISKKYKVNVETDINIKQTFDYKDESSISLNNAVNTNKHLTQNSILSSSAQRA